MADRSVNWKALADFSRVRREAEKTDRSLANLERREKSLSTAGTDSETRLERSERQRVSSTQRVTAAIRAMSSAERESRAVAKASADSSSALSQARMAQVGATNSLEKAHINLAAAQSRATETAKSAKATDIDRRRSLLGVADAHLAVEREASRLKAATERLALSQRSAGRDGNFLSGILKSQSTHLRDAGKAARDFGVSLKIIGIPVIASGIAGLIRLVSDLSAGFMAMAGAMGPALSIVATIPGLVLAAGAAVGTLVAGFAGIGGALKAYSKDQASAGKTAKSNAAATKSSARAITSAQKQVTQSQVALNQARRDAVRNLEDMQRAVRDAALAERGASMSVEEARLQLQRTMNDPGSTDLERRQAKLAVDDAMARLDDASRATKDANKANADAQKKGVENADNVVQAKDAQAQATQALSDAIDAQRQATASASAANSDYAKSMASLTPEARAFVRQLIALKPKLDQLRKSAQRGLLPGAGQGLSSLMKLFPIILSLVDRTSRQFGSFFARAGRNMTTVPNMAAWDRVFKSTTVVIGNFLGAIEHIGQATLRIADAARPLTEWVSQLVLRFGQWADRATAAGEASGRLAGHFDKTRTVLEIIGRTLGNVFRGLGNVAGQGEAFGLRMGRSIEGVSKHWADWTDSVAGTTAIQDWYKNAEPTMYEFGSLIRDTFNGLFNFGKDIDLAGPLNTFRTKIGPALGSILESLGGGDFLDKAVKVLGQIADVLVNISSGNSALSLFMDAFSLFLSVLQGISNLPGGATILMGLFTAVSLFKALKLMDAVLGISSLTTGIHKLFAEGNGADKKAGVLRRAIDKVRGGGAVVPGVAGGAATVVGGRSKGGAHAAPKKGGRGKKIARGAGKAGGAVGGLAAAAYFLLPDSVMQQAGGTVSSAISAAMFLPMLTPALKPIGGLLSKIGGGFTKALSPLGRFATGAGKTFLGFLKGIGPMLGKFVGLIGKFGSAIASVASKVLPMLISGLRAMGVAMMANPVAVIIGLIVGLGVALFVLYKKNETFRNAVQAAWKWIQGAISWAWNNVIKPVFTAISWYITKVLIPVFSWLWNNVIKPAFAGIGQAISDSWNKVIKPILQAFGDFIFKTLPGLIGKGISAIGTAWDKLKDLAKTPINWIIETVLNNGLFKAFNWVAEKLGSKLRLHVDPIGGSTTKSGTSTAGGVMKGWAEGGPVPGTGNSDSVPAMLTPGEFVVRKKAARRIGSSRLSALNSGDGMFDSGGGVVGKVADFFHTAGDKLSSFLPDFITAPAKWLSSRLSEVVKNPPGGEITKMLLGIPGKLIGSMVDTAKKWLGFGDTMGARVPGSEGMGWAAQWAWLSKAMPGLQLFSSYRPGAITASGNQSYHALGRAIDVTPSMAVFNLIKGAFGASIRELIYSPANNAQVKNGRNYFYGEPVRSMHFNHVHWAMATGGRVPGSGNGDTVPAMLTPGEFVVRKKAAKKIGLKRLHLLNQADTQHFATGGVVHRVLRYGSSGSDVKVVQGVVGTTKDGIFGRKTLAAVKAFQKKYKLAVDGIVGPKTWAKIDSYIAAAAKKSPTAATKPGTITPALTAIETAAAEQKRTNALMKEFNGYLDTFATWGLPELVSKLIELGPADGMEIARAGVKNRAYATDYNTTLREAADIAGTSGADSTKFMALLNSGTNVGIRSLARELQVPDYAVVQMYEKLLASGRLNQTDPNRMWQLAREVALFRTGLFYASGGGAVPGTGSGDSVPAMLSPGEFVLRRAAVRALGLDNVRQINRYAAGGFVYSPQVAGAPSVSRAGSVAAARAVMGASTSTVNVNTTINNPVRETSTTSLNKMLRRRAALGTFGPDAELVDVNGTAA